MERLKTILFVLALLKLTESAYHELQFDLNEALSVNRICSVINSSYLSTKCLEQFEESCSNQSVLNLMLDASSKFPYSGLNERTRFDLGNFDECININHKYPNGTILGKYCTHGLILNDLSDVTRNSSFNLSTCIPDGCSASDYDKIFQNMYSQNFPGVFTDTLCTTQESKPLTTSAIIVLLVLSMFVLLMILSTIYDFYLYQNNLRCSHKLYIAFSVFTNGRNMLRTSKTNKEQISVFHGLRFISTIWIIYGHLTFIWKNFPLMNKADYEGAYGHWYSFANGLFLICVDTFFYMSGFLLAYQYLKSRNKPFRSHIESLPRFYLHRYLRIAPAMIMIYLVTSNLITYMANGPLATLGCQYAKRGCEPEHLWAFFLFMQNYYDHRYCIGHVWYLSADMQMYFLSPLIIIPLAMKLNRKEFKSSMLYLLALNTVFFFIPIIVELFLDDHHSNYYETHPRLITFGFGIMVGTFMREKRDMPFLYNIFSKKRARVINLITWSLILPLMFCSMYSYNYIHIMSIYMVIPRPFWCIGLTWIIYSCYHGYGGIINWILSTRVMQIGGKISYSMYLLQLIPMFVYHNSIRTVVNYSELEHSIIFWGMFVIIIPISFFWYLAFEAPVVNLEKVIFGKRTTKVRGTVGQLESSS